MTSRNKLNNMLKQYTYIKEKTKQQKQSLLSKSTETLTITTQNKQHI